MSQNVLLILYLRNSFKIVQLKKINKNTINSNSLCKYLHNTI